MSYIASMLSVHLTRGFGSLWGACASPAAVLAAACAMTACGGSGDEPAPAQTIRVPRDAPNIAAAIAQAPWGYTVLLDDGVYLGAQNRRLDAGAKQIKLRSRSGAGGAIVDCEGVGPFITFGVQAALSSEVTGLTVRNCAADIAGAIELVAAAPLIAGNVFENTSQPPVMGVQISGNGASANIQRNVFRNTDCNDGFLSGVLAFINVSSPYVANNIFVQNRCRAINMILPVEAAPIVVNNTIVANTGGIRVDRNLGTALHWYGNNLIVGNTVGVDVESEYLPRAGEFVTFHGNLVFGNTQNYAGTADLTGRQGNLSADPLLFATPTDLRPRPGSPVQDAGVAPHAPRDDFDGRARAGAVDIGAFEVQ
ncbi:MAG TPA: choice-of-anchor Q domain-containing protein [Burkholderiaceae bacterium]